MKKNHKILVVSCAAVLLVPAGLWVVSSLSRARPVPEKLATPEQTVEYLASEAFVRMAPDEKQQYIEAIQLPGSQTPVLSLLSNPNVSDDQRRRVMENVLPVMAPVISRRLDEFDRLPLPGQKARLDAVIDQLQKAKQDNAGPMSSAERLNLVLQYVDPHTRAKIRKHIPALLVRMKERGIQGLYPF